MDLPTDRTVKGPIVDLGELLATRFRVCHGPYVRLAEMSLGGWFYHARDRTSGAEPYAVDHTRSLSDLFVGRLEDVRFAGIELSLNTPDNVVSRRRCDHSLQSLDLQLTEIPKLDGRFVINPRLHPLSDIRDISARPLE